MRKNKLVVLLLLVIMMFPCYAVKAENIKTVKCNTNSSIEFLEKDDTSKSVCKNPEDIKIKSIVLVALFVIVISSKCAYTAFRLKNYDKY